MCGKKSFPVDWPTLVSNNESGLSLQTGSKQTWEHLHVQRSSIQREFVTKISYNIFYREYLVRQREHWWGLQSSLNAQLLSAQYYCICRILGVCSYPHPHLALLANRLLKEEERKRIRRRESSWRISEIFTHRLWRFFVFRKQTVWFICLFAAGLAHLRAPFNPLLKRALCTVPNGTHNQPVIKNVGS